LILYNAWDAGTAKAIADAGSHAIGTSSWAVAAAHGYEDGESIPLSFVEQVISRIVHTVKLPVTVDVEGGYSDDPDTGAANIERLVNCGAVGINFEDGFVSKTGLHTIEAQCARIAAIRRMADARGIPLFINARTDLFLGTGITPESGLDEAIKRAAAYAKAGASGFFVPGLVDLHVITQLCNAIELPLNVMVMPGLADTRSLSAAGVARISYGPTPYFKAMETVAHAAQQALA
jgi:2-methylisocitrate lyase-like PEP mutase family enzyme